MIESILRDLMESRGTPEGLATVLDLCRTVKGSTLCPSGDAFAAPIEAMIVKFRPEFESLCVEAATGFMTEPVGMGPLGNGENRMSGGKTILVIDDDPDVGDFCTLVLQAEGYRVRYVSSAAEGRDALKTERPDLVILDIMMEEADAGIKLAKTIAHSYPGLPVALFSAIADASAQVFDTGELPVAELVEKTIKPPELVRTVRRLLARADKH